MKKRSRKSIVKSCDDLVSILLRAKQDNTCEYCGVKIEGRNSQVHHIRSRKWYASRWRLENLLLLCASCHRGYHDGIWGKEWVRDNQPLCYKWIESQKRVPIHPWKNYELEEIEDDLKRQIGDME